MGKKEFRQLAIWVAIKWFEKLARRVPQVRKKIQDKYIDKRVPYPNNKSMLRLGETDESKVDWEELTEIMPLGSHPKRLIGKIYEWLFKNAKDWAVDVTKFSTSDLESYR